MVTDGTLSTLLYWLDTKHLLCDRHSPHWAGMANRLAFPTLDNDNQGRYYYYSSGEFNQGEHSGYAR